jgi:hypothetical protein
VYGARGGVWKEECGGRLRDLVTQKSSAFIFWKNVEAPSIITAPEVRR